MPKQSRNLGDMPTSVESSIKDVPIDVVKENADKNETSKGEGVSVQADGHIYTTSSSRRHRYQISLQFLIRYSPGKVQASVILSRHPQDDTLFSLLLQYTAFLLYTVSQKRTTLKRHSSKL